MNVVAAIPSPSVNVIEIGPLTIHFYGIFIAVGVFVAITVAAHRLTRFGGERGVGERLGVWIAVIGFLGARLAYVSTHTGRFEGRPWAVFFLWEGGLALYGGLFVGAITLVLLSRRWDLNVLSVLDSFAVGVPLAQAIGRWGNYFNQELFGTPSDLPWAIMIDPAKRPEQYLLADTFHPTFLYESMWNALILVPVILLLERAGKLARGATLGVYLMMYAAIRFAMELLRTDTTFRFWGLSRNGWVSIAVFASAAVWLWWVQRRGEPRTLIGEPTLLSPQPASSGGPLDQQSV
jgi:prolipoprotein diacylglyceryl transferase